MKIAILEDSEVRVTAFQDKFPDAFITSNPDEFVNFCRDNSDDLVAVFFDHDLEFFVWTPYKQEITGFHAARAAVDVLDKNKTSVVVHSSNVVGSQKIYNVFSDAGFDVHKLEFPKCLKVNVG